MANFKSKERRISAKIVILSIIIAILLIINIYLIYSGINANVQEEKIISEIPKFISFDNSTLVSIRMPAIDDAENGVLTYLTVEATPGTGRILVDIDNLLFWEDTQQSMRTARKVAATISGKNIDEYDLIYNIYANASTIGGPSAGAAITMATLAALEGKKLRDDVMITGSINHDGSLGPAGSILEKAKAAKLSGAKVFLVPLLQSRDVVYEITKNCETFGWTEICSTEQIPRKINIASDVGITVIEIENMTEAMRYMIA